MVLLTAVVVALALWAIVLFNRLVRDRNRVRAAWSDIDVQLKRRHDLIPNLVEAVRQYARYEQATLHALIALRSRTLDVEDIAAKGPLEGQIGAGVNRLIALAEAYPDLKANQNFLALQRDLVAVEDHLQYARRYYNGAVRNLNTRIETFPDTLIARLFVFVPQPYFELEAPDEARSPEVQLP